MTDRPIVVAVGDPAGAGPIVAVRAAAEASARMSLVLFGDAAQLSALARAEGVGPLVEQAPDQPARLSPGQIGVVDTGRVSREVIALRAPSAEGGVAQLRTLRRAAEYVRLGCGRTLVTGPTSKSAIVRAGHRFIGQTEFLAQLSGIAEDAVTMMFLGPRLRVALVTTHLAIVDAPKAITGPRVARTIRHMAEVLMRLRAQPPRRLVVAGLNPHAGEEGLFGREEIDVIQPTMAALAPQEPFASGAVSLRGPAPAEAVFRAGQRGDIEGVVAMLHDQATIASKLLDWGSAVNTTWGLPFVRTSVDHGVAYDAVARGSVDAEGMQAALDMAVQLTEDEGGHAR